MAGRNAIRAAVSMKIVLSDHFHELPRRTFRLMLPLIPLNLV